MKIRSVRISSHRKTERGSVLAYTVLSVLFLFFAVGLGVDLSHLYSVKAELQNTADAAALAGASALKIATPDRITTAVDRAVAVMNLNKYNFNNKDYVDDTSLADQRALVRFAINLSEFDDGGTGLSEGEATANPSDIRFVKVTTPDVPVSIFFSIPILGLSRDLDAKAVAGLSVPGNTNFCILPMSAVGCNPGDTNCKMECRKKDDPSTPTIDEKEPGCKCDPTASDYPQPECTKYYGFCPGTDPHAEQTYTEKDPEGNDVTITCDPTKEFCKGCTYTVRSEPAHGPAAGAYNLLACAGTGKCDTRMALAEDGNCKCQASPGDELETLNEPGQAAGPVRQGLNVRFDIYSGAGSCDPATDPDCDDCQPNPEDHPPDLNVAQPINHSQYDADSPHLDPPDHLDEAKAGRRVVVVPIVPLGEYTDGNGRQFVRPSKFGGFFIKEQVENGSGDIKFEYIGDNIIDIIGLDPEGDTTSNVVTPVLYR